MGIQASCDRCHAVWEVGPFNIDPPAALCGRCQEKDRLFRDWCKAMWTSWGWLLFAVAFAALVGCVVAEAQVGPEAARYRETLRLQAIIDYVQTKAAERP